MIFDHPISSNVANNSLFINFATMLWALSIEPTRSYGDRPVVPNLKLNDHNGFLLFVIFSNSSLQILTLCGV